MADKSKTPTERLAYARGYAAGKRRADREGRAAEIESRRERFRREAFLAILPAMIVKGTWGKTVDGKHVPYSTMPDYARAAWNFASEAAKGTYFA